MFENTQLAGEPVPTLIPVPVARGRQCGDFCGYKEMVCALTSVDTVAVDQGMDDPSAVENVQSGSSSSSPREMLGSLPEDNVFKLDVDNSNTSVAAIGGEENGEHLTSVSDSVVITSSTVGSEEEGCDFLSLSPLRTLVRDELESSSGINISDEACVMGCCNTDCQGGRGTTDGSSVLATNCSLATDTAKQAERFLEACVVPSTTYETSWIDGRCGDLLLVGSDQKTSEMIDAHMLLGQDSLSFIGSSMQEHVCSGDIADKILSDQYGGGKDQEKESGVCYISQEMDAATEETCKEEQLILHGIAESCNLSQVSSGMVSKCSHVAESVSQQSYHHSSVREDHLLRKCQTSDTGVADAAAAECSSTFGNGDTNPHNGAENGVKFEFSSSICRRTNPKRAASLKSKLSIGSSDCLDRRKNNRTAKKTARYRSSIRVLDFSKIARRPRSSRKTATASLWGATENICQLFMLNDDCSTKSFYTKRDLRKARSKVEKQRQSADKKTGKGAQLKSVSSKNASTLKDRRRLLPASPNLINQTSSGSSGLNHCLSDDKGFMKIVPKSEQSCSVQHPHCMVNLSDPCTSLGKDGHHGDKDLESSVTQEISVENNLGELPDMPLLRNRGSTLEFSDDRLLTYPGNSPESDVVHPTTDISIVASDYVTSEDQKSHSGNGCRDVYIPDSIVKNSLESDGGILPAPGVLVLTSAACFQSKFEQERLGDSNFRNCYNRKTTRKAAKNVSDQEHQVKQSSLGMNQLPSCEKNSKADINEQNHISSRQNGKIIKDNKAGASKCQSRIACSEGSGRRNLHDKKKEEKPVKLKEEKPVKLNNKKAKPLNQFANKTANHTNDACLDDNEVFSTLCSGMQNACLLSETAETTNANMAGSNLFENLERGSTATKDISKKVLDSEVVSLNERLPFESSEHGLEKDSPLPLAAWVCCDECFKWRCIPAPLADILNKTNCKWTCKDNNDVAFADCSIPQEKTDAEINAELGISDEEDPYNTEPNSKESGRTKSAAEEKGSWTSIKNNIFSHRSRKKQTIDEIMVCHCKPPKDGSLGCQDDCLNRVLNIECVRGTCPCGDLCSNQQFQDRKYAKLKKVECAKKGYGLQVLENISEGKFLIEYVGEVLDMAEYESRQRIYASRGQEHFYFMTLNGSEVIDACTKGNLGRFVNHSCDPNCRTEKWLVKGEVCVGLFAIRDIKKGEEVTFDYNYVRVFGAAPKKCFCGSAECQGYIGGDPVNSEHIVQADSDGEYAKSMIVCDDGPTELGGREKFQATTDATILQGEVGGKELDMDKKIQYLVNVTPEQYENISPCAADTINESSVNAELKDFVETTSTACRHLFDALPTEVSSKKSSSDSGSTSVSVAVKDGDKRLSCDTVDGKRESLKIHNRTKSSRSRVLTRKVVSTVNKFLPPNIKKTGGGHSQFEGVEGKLNELLDTDGGISKRKDSTKGYLKLLAVTAASDNAGSETIQSTRDLSLILDAILKTKSRTVLTDIVNKNGLQMLHNMLKQNRKNGIKIPILRKLLKVFEFLASKEILSSEKINMDPSCVGVESFKDSIIGLTYHSDNQIHLIARSFRDRWIPRASRKAIQADRDGSLLDTHNKNSRFQLPCNRQCDQAVKDTDAIDSFSQTVYSSSTSAGRDTTSEIFLTSCDSSNHVSSAGSNFPNATRTRKRKSRWDQDKPQEKKISDPQPSRSLGDSVLENSSECLRPGTGSQSDKVDPMSVSEQDCLGNGAFITNSLSEQDIDEVPPGFESPPGFGSHNCEHPEVVVGMPTISSEVVIGKIQERYLSHTAVSHGIPLALMQQLGTPASDDGCTSYMSWTVAPGMPFHPFPPLPPYPRGTPELNSPPTSAESSSATGKTHRNVVGETTHVVTVTGSINPESVEGRRRPAFGRGSFRQQRCNGRRYDRFGLQGRSNQQFKVNGGGRHCVVPGNARKEVAGNCVPGSVRSEDAASTFNQQPNHSQSQLLT